MVGNCINCGAPLGLNAYCEYCGTPTGLEVYVRSNMTLLDMGRDEKGRLMPPLKQIESVLRIEYERRRQKCTTGS